MLSDHDADELILNQDQDQLADLSFKKSDLL